MGPHPPLFWKKSPREGLPSQPCPMACQFPNPHPLPDDLWAVTEHDWSPAPPFLSAPSQAPIPETLLLPWPSTVIIPYWGRGAILSSVGLQLPFLRISSYIKSLSEVFTQEIHSRGNTDWNPTKTLALLQADTKQRLSLNENHRKADRPQISPVCILLLSLPCNFTSQKQNWQQEDSIY